jgi:meso-butanediol dehydrogenase / (S,S)-butanediol dehydrogenase / diacetyl reductase
MPVALVTGATGGLGRAIVLRLARDGFDIAINDLGARASQLQSLAKEISESNRNASIVTADVTKDNEVQQMIAQAADDLGGLDVVRDCYHGRIKYDDCSWLSDGRKCRNDYYEALA